MSNTVITNYTDLNGPSSKADSSVVVIVNKDGSLSVDQNLLGTLMGTDGSQSAGISVVRVGHEGKPDDATDSESEDDKIPHVTLTVDSYYNEPNSIIKYDSGAEMLQSLRIETRENSLLGFQNDHCYTPLTSPSQSAPERSDSFTAPYDEPVIEITHTPPPKPVPSSKKITILEQKIIPKGKKIHINPPESPVILKGNDALKKPLPVAKPKETKEIEKEPHKSEQSCEESAESSSSGESILDRDSDSDYTDRREPNVAKTKKSKSKPRMLQPVSLKSKKTEKKSQPNKQVPLSPQIPKKELKDNKNQSKVQSLLKDKPKQQNQTETEETHVDLESLLPSSKIAVNNPPTPEFNKVVVKQVSKKEKKEKKAPAHPALLTDMTSLFSTPDVIRRISTDNKAPGKIDKDIPGDKQPASASKLQEPSDVKPPEPKKQLQQTKLAFPKANESAKKEKIVNSVEKPKGYDLIPQLDDASLAQILQDTSGIPSNTGKNVITTPSSMVSPGLAGPLSPTLDLLGGLQPEEDLSEDLLMHVAQLVESSENLQEVIDKQVLGKVDTAPAKPAQSPFQQANLYTHTLAKTVQKSTLPRKEPIEIVRRDGRVITLPPIEAPATRSKRRSQAPAEPPAVAPPAPAPAPAPAPPTPEPHVLQASISKQYINKKLIPKKQEPSPKPSAIVEKMSAESQESWNSEDDPNRLWCICKQPHNNRFMICCDGCEDWFHGKCVNITKAMGQQMEEQGIEWRCPNCVKKTKTQKSLPKAAMHKKNITSEDSGTEPVILPSSSKTGCIVCKKAARASSIYCSDACILKHAQDSLSPPPAPHTAATHDKKADSRVIVYERKSGRLLAGPNAPTAENLKAWLQKNPTFEVVRPGALSSFKPGSSKKKPVADATPKIQTTLNFERIPRKQEQATPPRAPAERKLAEDKTRTPAAVKASLPDTPRPAPRPVPEPRKITRTSLNRSQSNEKPSPSTSSRRKDSSDSKSKMSAPELDIRENVRKSLQEQMSLRMAENTHNKLTEEEIQKFAEETELELHELFRDTGVKYKAKYRSLMFNIKDRKNLTLWEKICDKSISPKQLVRLSPEELASQELAEWRDQESKHQLELIKKSELDLLAASKTYVLKTHKGEEVMETKEATELELDPNVPVEDVVIALNDSTVGEEVTREVLEDGKSKPEEKDTKKDNKKKRQRDRSSSRSSKRSRRDSRRDSERKSDRSRRSEIKERREEGSRRSSRHAEKHRDSRARSSTRGSKSDSKEKSRSRSRHRSRSRDKDKRSKSRDHRRERSRSRARPDTSAHRSRSQDNYAKNKTDSTDSDSVERPKSAMQKDPHPEYDPHEPMITSAFSEEDLRKTDDGYDPVYKSEVVDPGPEYDPAKSFTLDTNICTTPAFSPPQDKPEVESDQEPTSTVENAAATIWNGCINMVDVARFYVAAYEVSGSSADLEEELNTELDIVGRINPDTVWDYINKTKKTSNKDIVILRLQAANDEEKMQYIALYSYLSSRNRLGVVKVAAGGTVKDLYMVPLAAGGALPPVLLPLRGPGLGDTRGHLLLAVIVRQRRKRHLLPKPVVPAKVSRVTRKRSYTPPTSPRRRQLPLPAYTSAALSTSVKDKIAASLASAELDEAYSPGSDSGAPTTLRSKMEELNRQIEEQKQQILKMAQADSSVVGDEEEAYSPSRPLSPAAPVAALADIALPSNLHEILATIKQRSGAADVDMRNPPLP